jgi:hypothetical protein
MSLALELDAQTLANARSVAASMLVFVAGVYHALAL